MSKVISLSEKAYVVLKKLKKEGDSFSDVVLRLSKKNSKKPLSAYAGKWSGEDAMAVYDEVRRERETVEARKVGLY